MKTNNNKTGNRKHSTATHETMLHKAARRVDRFFRWVGDAEAEAEKYSRFNPWLQPGL